MSEGTELEHWDLTGDDTLWLLTENPLMVKPGWSTSESHTGRDVRTVQAVEDIELETKKVTI